MTRPVTEKCTRVYLHMICLKIFFLPWPYLHAPHAPLFLSLRLSSNTHSIIWQFQLIYTENCNGAHTQTEDVLKSRERVAYPRGREYTYVPSRGRKVASVQAGAAKDASLSNSTRRTHHTPQTLGHVWSNHFSAPTPALQAHTHTTLD